MDSFQEESCSIAYGMTPDCGYTRSIIYPEDKKSVSQKKLELKRGICEKLYKKRQKKCGYSKEMILALRQLKCQQTEAKKENGDSFCKKQYKRCPFINSLQTILEISEENSCEELINAVNECHMNECMDNQTDNVEKDNLNNCDFVVINHQDIHIDNDEEYDEGTGSCEGSSTSSLPTSDEEDNGNGGMSSGYVTADDNETRNTKKIKKKEKGLLKLWKQFHAFCDRKSSSHDPLRDGVLVDYYPGGAPAELPVLF